MNVKNIEFITAQSAAELMATALRSKSQIQWMNWINNARKTAPKLTGPHVDEFRAIPSMRQAGQILLLKSGIQNFISNASWAVRK